MRLLLALAFALAPAFPAGAAPKNVVLLVADDLGFQVGCYGDPVAKTPNIDALAKNGTRFTHGFASVASCSPSRATLLTGMPTHQCGQYGLAHATHNASSFKTVKGLPALLGPAGYRSGVIAKLHVQPKEVYPFDVEVPGGGRNPVQIAQQAKTFIADCGEKPFFLLVGFTDPHRAAKGFANDGKYPASVPAVTFDPKTVPVPYHLPDNAETRGELADYYQSVARLDHGVGLVLKELEAAKKLDDTLVIFLSDNGIPFPGAKATLYDAGIHLPLIVRKPGQKPGVACGAMASWTDIAPTVLDWCGVKPAPVGKKDAPLPGRSLLPVLETEKADGWDAAFASHQYHEVTMYYPMRAVRTRTHKYILNLAHPLEFPSASDLWGSDMWQGVLKRKDTMMGRRAVGAFLHRPKEELYDLTADPNELKNIAADAGAAKVLDDLRAKLADWRKKTNDPWLIKDQHE
ncbi:sulfatase [Gemmata sp. JC673]|uniref:Sulfatase n=1 Tax=Gemmata algarum TaxID=2975278 RepID=A0ABU5EXP5_9BACT|nr:sulfatase [Gemmata algarum]MDY3559714.1 sulfatase [Gemmata algarum]